MSSATPTRERHLLRDAEARRIGWVPRTLVVPVVLFAAPALCEPLDTINHRAFVARITGQRA